MAASEVPFARCWSLPDHRTWSGTITKPPPTPSSPPARPPRPPIAASMRGLVCLRSPLNELREPADVEVHNLLIIQQLLPRALEAVLPEHEHVRPLSVPKRLTCVFLDHQHGDVGRLDLFHFLPDQTLGIRRQGRAPVRAA